MPFTVSHAIVAAPFVRTPIPVAAVAVGSMTPDVVLFVPWGPSYWFTHWFPGVITFDLAVALAAVAVWWFVIRPGWLALASATVRDRVEPLPPFGPRRAVLTVVGALIGIVSHVAWDACTHVDGAVVTRVPWLASAIGGHPVFSLLQDTSSILGLLAVLVVVAVRVRRLGLTGTRLLGAATVVVAAVVLAVSVVLIRDLGTRALLPAMAYDVAVVAVQVAAVAVTVVGIGGLSLRVARAGTAPGRLATRRH